MVQVPAWGGSNGVEDPKCRVLEALVEAVEEVKLVVCVCVCLCVLEALVEAVEEVRLIVSVLEALVEAVEEVRLIVCVCVCAGGPGGGGGGGKADCVCVCAGRCKRARAVDLEFVCTQHPILQELGGLAVGADVRVAVQTIHGRLAAAQVNVLGYLWMLCSICRK